MIDSGYSGSGDDSLVPSSLQNRSCFAPNLSRDSVTEENWIALANWSGTSPYVGIIVTFLSLFGTPSNIFVIFAMIIKRREATVTTIFVINLIVANLLMCILVMPFASISGITGTFPFGNSDYQRCSVCQASGVIFFTLVEVIVHTKTLISLDRFIYIKFAMKYEKIVTTKRAFLAVVLIWIYSILITTPPLYRFGEIPFFSSCTLVFAGVANSI